MTTNLESFQFRFPKFSKPKWFRYNKRYHTLLVLIAAYFTITLIHIRPTSVTVGNYAGECMGYCHTTYQISNNSVQLDAISTVDSLPSIHKTIKGDFSTLKFSVPLRLLFHIGTFGDPDSVDQGGYILGFKLAGLEFDYEIDKGSEPWYFPNMTDIVGDRMRRLNPLFFKPKQIP